MAGYYIAHPDDNNPSVYIIDGEWLAHTVPDWEHIETSSDCRVWRTTSKRKAIRIAERLRHYGARVVPWSR